MKAIVIYMLLLVGTACSHSDGAGSTQSPPGAPSQQNNETPSTSASANASQVVLATAPKATRVDVEVVRTPHTIRKGLMYRQHLPANRGMLFLMQRERDHSFWMRNTLIPLDMIFISKTYKVVGVVENAQPMTETSRRVGKPSVFVLEVNAGFAARNHIVPGTNATFENIKLTPAEAMAIPAEQAP